MKLTSFGAGLTGVALVAGSILLGAVPATAATIDVTAPVPIPDEASFESYPEGWFAGEVTGGDGTASQDERGLEINPGTTGYQLLNGDPANGTGNTTAAATNPAVSTTGGDAFYQISVFAEPGQSEPGFTTLRPVDAQNLNGNWVNSRAFPADTAIGGTVAELTGAPLAIHLGFLDDGVAAEVLAFGVFMNPGDPVTLRAISWNGDTYLFADAPTVTVSAASIPEAGTDPIIVTATGFAPGEEVSIGLGSGYSGGEVDTAVANAEGVVTYELKKPGAGSYTVSVSSIDGLFSNFATFEVVAAAVVDEASPADELPPTGVGVMSSIIAASALLFAGAGLLVFSMRRKAAKNA
ncbi:hypothetical protein ADILRU_2720 [Leifsonia rubra CMS 76R]|nr:hypothetical protein ADILRU_2720 [Leifsonia rubra CMS 76R]